MKSVDIIYIGNDMIMEVSGVSNGLTGAMITTASATITLIDEETGTPVSGESWPKAMSHVTATPGTYRANVPDSMVLSDFQRLLAQVEIDAGPGQRASFRVPFVARHRT